MKTIGSPKKLRRYICIRWNSSWNETSATSSSGKNARILHHSGCFEEAFGFQVFTLDSWGPVFDILKFQKWPWVKALLGSLVNNIDYFKGGLSIPETYLAGFDLISTFAWIPPLTSAKSLWREKVELSDMQLSRRGPAILQIELRRKRPFRSLFHFWGNQYDLMHMT